ncbi:MAG TPA: nitrate- and nitrite sensing domain-containing protein, partial [Rugosimonospora sp.]|nr:nitrate- and nitrite sensing domain-containing protein [Rugosimonospora sp.]
MSGRSRRQRAARPTAAAIQQARGTIRGRLLRILAVPLVVVVVLLGVVISRDLTDYRTARETTDAVKLVLTVQDLVQALQTERGLTAGFLGGDVGFQKEMVASRTEVDSERGALSGLLLAAAGQSSAAHDALSALDSTISATRDGIDQKKIDRTAAFDYFTSHISALNAVNFGLDSSSDNDLRRGVATLTALGTVKEQYSQERALLNGVFSAGGYVAGEYARYAQIVATKTQALATFDSNATAGQKWLKDYALDTGAAREAKFFEDRALGDPSERFKEQTNPQSWWSAFTTVLADLRTAQEAVGSDITAIAKSLQAGATQRLGILGGLVILGALGAAVVLAFSAQSITRPLRSLVREAESLAQHRLPEAVARAQGGHEELAAPLEPVAVPPGASSEIVSLVGALERVQNTAYLLATEQAMLRRSTAESLANLGRRNQNLLRRQLSFITRLEQEESDPQGLANLFELDHLATRMRRNAESLLVLVGEATPRRWAAPLPIADVIRAAISEVEEYRRVSLKRIDDGWIGGAYVAGIAHMIAELVENGLSFSPPDLDVEIQGRNLGGRYLIAITDQGVGMDQAEMDRANARLRGEENYLSVPTRFLGHYVVGHLAEQMGVEVEISPSPVTGITARVTLPSPVLQQPPALAPGGPSLAEATGSHPHVGAVRGQGTRMDARVEARVDEAQIVAENDDWATAPARALGTRPVVEYVPMSSAPTGYGGHATSALPLVEAQAAP